MAPYTPNLVLHNEIRKRARNWGNLYSYEKEMAIHHMNVIDGNRQKLVDKMSKMGLVVKNLELMPHHLARAGDSDGLHLGNDAKKALFGTIIDAAVKMHKNGPPVVKEVGFVLDPAVRDGIAQMRRHKRRQKRTREAESEIFKQLEKEKTMKNCGSTVSEA